MEYLPGSVYKEMHLPNKTPEQKKKIYSEMCHTLAKIHMVDISKAALDDYGKKGKLSSRRKNIDLFLV